MATTTPPPPPPEEPRRPFQFSMATLMGAITLVAVGLAVIVAAPAWVGGLLITVLRVGFLIFLFAGALFAKGSSRTFCIGAIATQFLVQDFMVVHASSRSNAIWREFPLSAATSEGVNLAVVLLGGWICIRARQFWEERNP